MEINIITKTFEELTTLELYQILHIRSRVFVVEQNSVYLDIDNKDQKSYHLLIYIGKNIIGCSRLLPQGVCYDEVSIGRIVLSPDYRGQGFGKKIVEESIKLCRVYFGNVAVKIQAQFYLLRFYESFGFVKISESYLEDGIMHIDMLKPPFV